MAVARSLVVDIAMNTAKITKDIQKIRGDFDQLGSAVKKLGGVLGVAFSINTLVRYGDAIIEQAKKAEQAVGIARAEAGANQPIKVHPLYVSF